MNAFTLILVLYSISIPVSGVKLHSSEPLNGFQSLNSGSRYIGYLKYLFNLIKFSSSARSISLDMSDVLDRIDVDYSKFCPNKSKDCHKILKAYLKRCKGHDCFTFDSVDVSDKDNKFKFVLPYLPEIDLAFYLFKKSGHAGVSPSVKLFVKLNKRNPIHVFIESIISTNLSKLSGPRNNDEYIANEFFYTAALYYKILRNAPLISQLQNLPLVKNLLKRVAKEVAEDNKLSLTISEVSDLVDAFTAYISEYDHGESEIDLLEYGNSCRHALNELGSEGEVLAGIKAYVTKNEDPANDYCVGDNVCRGAIDEYIKRCKKGDCYTLDNLTLTPSDPSVTVVVPNLKLVEFLFYAYRNSDHFVNKFNRLFSRILRMGAPDPFDKFVRDIHTYNVELLDFDNKNSAVLTRFLYYNGLYYEKYIFKSILALFHRFGINKLSKILVRLRLRRKLTKDLTKLLGGDSISLDSKSLTDLLAEFEDYLAFANEGKYKSLARAYTGICRGLLTSINTDDGGNVVHRKMRVKRKHTGQEGDEGEPEKRRRLGSEENDGIAEKEKEDEEKEEKEEVIVEQQKESPENNDDE